MSLCSHISHSLQVCAPKCRRLEQLDLSYVKFGWLFFTAYRNFSHIVCDDDCCCDSQEREKSVVDAEREKDEGGMEKFYRLSAKRCGASHVITTQNLRLFSWSFCRVWNYCQLSHELFVIRFNSEFIVPPPSAFHTRLNLVGYFFLHNLGEDEEKIYVFLGH